MTREEVAAEVAKFQALCRQMKRQSQADIVGRLTEALEPHRDEIRRWIKRHSSPRGGRSRRWQKRVRFAAKQRQQRACKRAMRQMSEYLSREYIPAWKNLLLFGQHRVSFAPDVVMFLHRDGIYQYGECGESLISNAISEQKRLAILEAALGAIPASPLPPD